MRHKPTARLRTGRTPLRLGLALLLPLVNLTAQFGGVDPSFAPGGGNNSGFDADVFSIAVQPDAKLVVGGSFTRVGRVTRNGVARLTSGGALDTSFDPGEGANGLVEAVILQSDGKVLAGGRFSTFAGQPRSYLARLNSNGSLDPTFDGEFNDLVLAVALQADGKFIIGGAFTAAGGASRRYVARLNPDGSADPAFDPQAGPDQPVHAVALQPDGRVVLGGQFTRVAGVPRLRIARLNPDGSLDTGFDPGGGADLTVAALCMQTDGRVLMGGGFTNVAGATRHYLARLNDNGSLDSTFEPGIALTYGGLLTLHAQVDGAVVIGGAFSSIDGVGRNGIARLRADGSLDPAFNPGSGPADSNGFTPFVRGIAIQPDGRMVVGGHFDSFAGVRINYLVRLLGDQGGAVEFTTTAATVDERAGMARLGLHRVGSLAGSVSVDFATAGGNATPGLDFTGSRGTVRFGAGESDQWITIPVVPDSLVEGDEQAILALGNPVGGIVLGSQQATTLTILDNTNRVTLQFSSIERVDSQRVRLVLQAPEGQICVLQSASAWSDWTPIQTNQAVGGACVFEDAGGASPSERFYRAVLP